VACPNDCSGHGACKLNRGEDAICDCDKGFATTDCSVGRSLFIFKFVTHGFLSESFLWQLSVRMTARCTRWKATVWKLRQLKPRTWPKL
jgi:hypothetical protein